MTPPRLLYVFGAGGHGREIAWLAREVYPDAVIEFAIDDGYRTTDAINGMPVRALSSVAVSQDAAFVTAVGDAALRMRAAAALDARGLRPVALVHPRAELAPGVQVGAGAVVCAGTVVTDNVRIGEHAIVNIGSTISHDVRIGAFATISPGVHIAGNVVVGERSLIGIGASIINGSPARPVVVGADAIVAAGATVIGDVADGATVGGVPARPLGRGRTE